MPTIDLDLGYDARDQFVPFHTRSKRWGCIVAHRRAGKTVACVMDLVDAALRCTKEDGRFGYIGPTYTQTKDVAWMYLKRYTSGIPGVEQRESDLSVYLPNKARVRLYGAENYDRLRGIYLDGVILDEMADIDPRAWSEVIRPALSDRQGWAVFIGTPRGRDAFFKLYKQACESDDWFSLRLKASETGILPAYELAAAKNDLTPEQFAQEYECSFDAAVIGAYYAKDITDAEADKPPRIASVPWDRNAEVITAWDLGHRDSTAIWFAQLVGREIHILDYYENSGQALDHYVKEVKSRPYVYGEHLLPHDAKAVELGTGKSRQEVLENLGLRVRIVPNHKVEDGINAVRLALSRCWFDASKCERGIDALRAYRAERNERHEVLKAHPLHDWSSHGSDAFRYLIMGMDERAKSAGWNKPDNSWVV